jgi:5-methyltetrahydrofolate--homocysteine methyltransferase
VRDIAAGYIAAGADMVQTNSIGGTSFKLGYYGLADRVSEINEAAAKLSREAAGADKWVIASMGPTGEIILPGDDDEDDRWNDVYDAYCEQAIAFEMGGADAVCIETMSSLDEAAAAICAVRENTRLEILCTFTFEKNIRGEHRTMMGVSPEDAVAETAKVGADIIGANCGNGIEGMIELVKLMREANKDIPILIHANAGLPQNIDGVDVFPETPEDMTKFVPELIKAGANIIGGCCGTTPAHIAAIKEKTEKTEKMI